MPGRPDPTPGQRRTASPRSCESYIGTNGSSTPKPPFGGPEQVLRYLGRYTHRVAISNHRLLAFDGDNVTFRWRDYAHGNVQRTMTITAEEFIRRFLLHVLPKGFVRIRHFGFMANFQRSEVVRTLPPTAGNGTGGPFHRRSFNRFGLVVSPLSRANDCYRETHCDADRLEIRFEMFFRYVVAEIPNRSSHDVLRHAAPTCVFIPQTLHHRPQRARIFQQRYLCHRPAAWRSSRPPSCCWRPPAEACWSPP